MKDGPNLQVQFVDAPGQTSSWAPLTPETRLNSPSSQHTLRRELDHLQRELATLRRREAEARAALARFDEEVRIFGRSQRDLCSPTFPIVPGLRIQTLHRPAEHVGGDVLDVLRLDDDRIGIMVLDATGHGLTAALIATVAGRVLRNAIERQDGRRISNPGEMLRCLNQELLARPTADCHFVSALIAVYDQNSRTIRWARGGSPYPILLPRGGDARQIQSQGPLVGIDDGARFAVVEMVIRPGDRLLFHTDGLEIVPFQSPSTAVRPHQSMMDWIGRMAAQTNGQLLSELNHCLDSGQAEIKAVDDVTIVALEGLPDAS